MNIKEIDEIFDYISDRKFEQLLKYSNVKISLNEFSDLSKEDKNQLLKKIVENIMYQIEEDDELYEYFTSKKENNIRIYNRLLSYTKKHTDDIFKVIEEYAKSGYKNIPYIENLIKATGRIKYYLTSEKIIELNLNYLSIIRLIEATGRIEDYLIPEKVKELNLKHNDITQFIKATGKIEEYLLPGQDENDKLYISNVYYKANKESFTPKMWNIIEKLLQKNSSLYSTIHFEILFETQLLKICNEEQLIRITHYPKVQEYFLRNNNNLMFETMEYLMKNDENWIISLEGIIENENKYKDLIDRLQSVDRKKITPEFIQNFLCIISDQENYFGIQNYDDVNNYSNKKNEICLDILHGNFKNPPIGLEKYSESDLYKFALLEYKFGISLEDAKRIIKRYGTDSDKLPKNTTSEYIRLLKTLIQTDNIKDYINYAIENELLEQPWLGFPNARNAEGQILNMFAELYNKTLYSTKIEDKEDEQELYIDTEGKEHQIDIYRIKKDFNLNVRFEGLQDNFTEPNNFNQYYENPNIDNHGNCESYMGNDLICEGVNGIFVNPFYGIMVGYNYIYPNTLTSCGTHDLGTTNENFSIYNEESDFRIPEEMKNHTRIDNEMVKERLFIDKNGEVVKSKPSYIIWIEEDQKNEREAPGWKKQREHDPYWIRTKKAAAQLGVPIVVIDREYFAQRETDKIDLMKKLITGEYIDEEKYKEYYEQYGSLSKTELIEQLIIKFENNRTGLRFNNDKLNRNLLYTRAIRKYNKRNRFINREYAR